jgi:hypothetical protein
MIRQELSDIQEAELMGIINSGGKRIFPKGHVPAPLARLRGTLAYRDPNLSDDETDVYRLGLEGENYLTKRGLIGIR